MDLVLEHKKHRSKRMSFHVCHFQGEEVVVLYSVPLWSGILDVFCSSEGDHTCHCRMWTSAKAGSLFEHLWRDLVLDVLEPLREHVMSLVTPETVISCMTINPTTRVALISEQ